MGWYAVAGGLLSPSIRPMPCRICVAASGHSDATKGLAFFADWRATGLPTLSATSKFSLSTPQLPPWPEQRSITATSGCGKRRSISAALAPMAWARAWQPGRQTFLARDIDDVFADVEGGAREALDSLVLRQDQRPFEFQHQRAGRHQRDDVVALLDVRRERRRHFARAV